MKRAIATHEATLVTISILLLQATLLHFNGHDWRIGELFSTIQSARDAMKDIGTESKKFKEAWLKLKGLLTILDLDAKVKEFEILQFFMKYIIYFY